MSSLIFLYECNDPSDLSAVCIFVRSNNAEGNQMRKRLRTRLEKVQQFLYPHPKHYVLLTSELRAIYTTDFVKLSQTDCVVNPDSMA